MMNLTVHLYKVQWLLIKTPGLSGSSTASLTVKLSADGMLLEQSGSPTIQEHTNLTSLANSIAVV
jgi:hypothetical protein